MSNKESTTSSTKMPFWVLMAFSSIHKRKHAFILIWSSILFTLYCLPWPVFFDNEIITTVFLIDDWSWVAMMIPITIWYILCLRWMDNHSAWESI